MGGYIFRSAAIATNGVVSSIQPGGGCGDAGYLIRRSGKYQGAYTQARCGAKRDQGREKMSWADKQLKKHRIHKMVEEAMNDPRYQEAQKKQLDETIEQAFDNFMVISVAYLHDKQKFGQKRLLDFVDYVVEQMRFVEEYPDYFVTMNEELAKETGVDVLKNIVNSKK